MKFVALWGPVVLVMALIFAASSSPDPGTPPAGLSDKGAHFLAYAALGASLVRALAGGRPSAMTLRRVLLAACLGTLYGVTDELHQSFIPNRTPDGMDLLADGAGAVAGAALLAALSRGLAKALARAG